jgi:hypothetical protein
MILAPATSPAVQWRSLARRGMLWSEVQVFDVLSLAPPQTVELGDDHYCEAVLVAAGELRLQGGGEPTLRTCHLLMLAQRHTVVATVAAEGTVVVRLRLLPAALARSLPYRAPALGTPPFRECP